MARLEERTTDRDTPISIKSYFAQLKACRSWGKEEPRDDMGSSASPRFRVRLSAELRPDFQARA